MQPNFLNFFFLDDKAAGKKKKPTLWWILFHPSTDCPWMLSVLIVMCMNLLTYKTPELKQELRVLITSNTQ